MAIIAAKELHKNQLIVKSCSFRAFSHT